MVVRIGLVGAGGRASNLYAPALAACPEVEFVAVWGRSPGPVRRLAQRHAATPCQRFEDLLERCAAVVFAVPPPVQEQYAAQAARRGRALLLEKPIGGDLAGAEQLAAVVAREQVPTMVALPWRFTAEVRRFLEVDVPDVEPVGGIGRLITGSDAREAPTPPWRLARGVLRDQAADLVDLLEAALGPVVDVHGHGDPRGWVSLQLDHKIGRFSQAALYAGAIHGPDVAVLEVTGPRGTAQVEALGAVSPDSHQRMLVEFAQAAAAGRSHALDVEHGLHLQRLVEAAETDLVLHG